MGEKNTFAEQNKSTNKKTAQKSGFFKNMAGVTGLEPMNGGIKTRCLTNLAIPQMVRKERLELSRREALEPKSSVSTNSTTSAQLDFPKRDKWELVATARFELATPSLWVMCSNQLSYVALLFSSLSGSGAYYAYMTGNRQPLFY